MPIRRDKLGRRIPEFDRSAASKKSAETAKEKYGPDFHARNGAAGGSHRGRGYFGQLKDEGKTEELKALSHQANEVKAQKAATTKTKKAKNTKRSRRSGSQTSVSGGKS